MRLFYEYGEHKKKLKEEKKERAWEESERERQDNIMLCRQFYTWVQISGPPLFSICVTVGSYLNSLSLRLPIRKMRMIPPIC